MKQYIEYMDGIRTSDTLHQRLTELEAPRKRPTPWARYGTMAAALVLVCGLGAWGLGRGGWEVLTANFKPAATTIPEIADIAIEDPNTTLEPGMKTDGGYEVQDGEMVSYFFLPGIDYGMADSVGQVAMDWDVPPGSTKRDLTQADIAALFYGADTLSTHLAWGGYELTGWAAWYADGSFWGAFVNGYKGPMDHFELAFTAGDTLPPTCFGHPDGVVNTLWDVPVTAHGWDNESGGGRIVEFLHDGYGFRFDITASDTDNACHLVSRITRWLILERVAADSITQDGAVLAHPWEADPNGSAGEPNWNDSVGDYDADCPDCVDGTAHTHPYDPREAADPSYHAPGGTE